MALLVQIHHSIEWYALLKISLEVLVQQISLAMRYSFAQHPLVPPVRLVTPVQRQCFWLVFEDEVQCLVVRVSTLVLDLPYLHLYVFCQILV